MMYDMALRRTNALTPEEDERVRVAVRKLVEEAGSQRGLAAELAAKGLRVSQQTINRHLNGDAAGREFAQLVARAIGVPFEELLGRAPTRDDALPRLDRIPGYPEAESEARRRAPYLPESVWVTTRASSGARLDAIDWPLVLELARIWHRVETGELVPYPREPQRPPPPKPRK